MFIDVTIKKFCNRFNNLLNDNSLTVTKLAKNTGIPRETLERYKNNPSESLSFKNVIILAQYFNVSVSYMVGETDTKKVEDIEIGNNLSIDQKTIDNLRKIKEINLKSNNKYKDLLSDVITNPELYNELLQQTEIKLNKDSKATVNKLIQEKAKKEFGKYDTYKYEDFANILICHKFLDCYKTYMTFKSPVSLGKNQLEAREIELRRELKAVQFNLKKYK